jgi:uncharacterized protein YdhG (YjbR/CyaY superfamily)
MRGSIDDVWLAASQAARVPKRKAVDEWFAKYQNPMKAVVMRIREIILAADPRMDECIKWQAPTFTFEGNLASFFPKSKQHASLMFHQGAKIPGVHPRLEGGGETGRMLKIASVAEANEARAEIEAIVRAWCEWKATSPQTKSRPARRTAAARRPPPKARRARAS